MRLSCFALACTALGANALGADDHAAHQHGAPAAVTPHHQQAPAGQPTQSERDHVAPAAPERPMHEMSAAEMIELMQMDDAASTGLLLIEQLEWRRASGDDELGWEARAAYGDDYRKLLLKTEGERVEGELEGELQVFWDRVLSRWWNLQLGARRDFGVGTQRWWAALGIEGLAPHWFDVEATLYLGEQGHSAALLAAEYEVRLTRRWILQPKLELELRGKDDPENHVGSGLANFQVALRLRYEVHPQLAPYVGMLWSRSADRTAELARAAGERVRELQFVAGLRMWF